MNSNPKIIPFPLAAGVVHDGMPAEGVRGKSRQFQKRVSDRVPDQSARVVCYGSDGQRIRDYSLDALLRLARVRKVYFTFGASGRLLHATFLPHDGSKVLRTAHMGQRYSFPERVGIAAGKVWSFSPFLNPRNLPGLASSDAHEIDLHVRAVFRAVPLSCMRREPEPPPPVNSKVVSIASARKPLAAIARERIAA